MSITYKITQALDDHNSVIVTGENQGRILEEAEKISGGIGRCLSNGAIAYNIGGKKLFVGDMPSHPSLGNAARITV